jgi:hypothetical protein
MTNPLGFSIETHPVLTNYKIGSKHQQPVARSKGVACMPPPEHEVYRETRLSLIVSVGVDIGLLGLHVLVVHD